jgi:hypothetical protein
MDFIHRTGNLSCFFFSRVEKKRTLLWENFVVQMKIVEVSLRDTLTIFARVEQGVRVRCQPATTLRM